MTKQIQINVENAQQGYTRFIDAWENAEKNNVDTHEPEVHLNFEDLTTLLSVLTPRRIELLKTLRNLGPISIRALAKKIARDYKNVHTDVIALENVGLIDRNSDANLLVPWDVLDTHFKLAA